MITMTVDMTICFEACCTAARLCLEASAVCADGGRSAQGKVLSECVTICQATATCLANGSDGVPAQCAACIECCAACAKACRAISDKQLTACIEACRACALCCEKLCQPAKTAAAKA